MPDLLLAWWWGRCTRILVVHWVQLRQAKVMMLYSAKSNLTQEIASLEVAFVKGYDEQRRQDVWLSMVTGTQVQWQVYMKLYLS